jgi:hypothetical protein
MGGVRGFIEGLGWNGGSWIRGQRDGLMYCLGLCVGCWS